MSFPRKGDSRMATENLIVDHGLFTGEGSFEINLTTSFETIQNLLQTIKEFREFADPEDSSWFEYIDQFFQIMGFKTNKIAQRLFSLVEVGGNMPPNALVCVVQPQEDFTRILLGLDWESYLFYAAKYYHVEWVILTNGLVFKFLNFGSDSDSKKYLQFELDEIIKTGRADSFFTFYKIFTIINRVSKVEPKLQKSPIRTRKAKTEKVLVERHYLRQEFWTQLLDQSRSKTSLFQERLPGTEGSLSIPAGRKGFRYGYAISTSDARVELVINNNEAVWNKQAFDQLFEQRAEIEESFGDTLVWDRLDEDRSCAIRYKIKSYGLSDKTKWPWLQEQMISAMIKLEKIIQPFIQQIE